MSKNTKMSNLLNYRLRITISDSRTLTGQMLAFDKHMNLVLGDCEEFRTIKPKKSSENNTEQQVKRTLGLVVLRGETIVSMSVDGPPPPSSDNIRRGPQMPAGAGMGRPLGRGLPTGVPGMPGMPPPHMETPGLRGPALGGPPMHFGQFPPPGPGGPYGFRPGMPPPPGMPPGFRPPPGGPPPPGFRPGMPPYGRPPPPPQ